MSDCLIRKYITMRVCRQQRQEQVGSWPRICYPNLTKLACFFFFSFSSFSLGLAASGLPARATATRKAQLSRAVKRTSRRCCRAQRALEHTILWRVSRPRDRSSARAHRVLHARAWLGPGCEQGAHARLYQCATGSLSLLCAGTVTALGEWLRSPELCADVNAARRAQV